MASVVQICNLALNFIGANTINALTEGSQEARRCNLIYEDVRDDLLASHAWNFAVVRIALATPVDDPPLDWSYIFQIPSDCLRPLYVEAATGVQDVEYRIESGRVLTNFDDDLTLVYVKRETDPEKYDPLFTAALWTRLAMELAFPLTNDENIVNRAEKRHTAALLKATNAHGPVKEEFSRTQTEDSWISGRR